VSQTMIPAIVYTQAFSLVTTAVGVWGAIALFTSSLALATVAVAPALITLLFLFGTMGFLGIPQGVATSLICGMVLGVGSDFAVYWLSAAPATGRHLSSRLRLAIPTEQPVRAIATITLAGAIGFGLLGLSRVPSNANLGLIVCITLVGCALITVVGVNAFLSLPGRSRVALRSPPLYRRW
jgi:predicted RND superfamily exporter protein